MAHIFDDQVSTEMRGTRHRFDSRLAVQSLSVPCLVVLAVFCAASLARGQGLVYVDAVASFDPFQQIQQNLFPAAGGPITNVASLDDTTCFPSDNKWCRRPYGAPTGGIPTIYESIFEDSPQLRMHVSGLIDGQQYGVYIVYWSDAGSSWAIRAGLQSGVNPLFDRDGSSGATAGTFAGNATWITPPADNDIDVDDSPFYDIHSPGEPPSSYRAMYIGFLGTATGVNGGFDVFIDDVPLLRRTWLDGVAYTIGLPGDYNHDSVVSAADFTMWRDTMGQSEGELAADGDFSGTVDEGDFLLWKRQFGLSNQNSGGGGVASPISGTTAPEPSSAGLILLGALILLPARRINCRGRA